LSEEFQKVTFPGKKNAFRLFDKEDRSIVDILTKSDEQAPAVNQKFLCRHPFIVNLFPV
jgi:nicotinate phosphoribosyltransferase